MEYNKAQTLAIETLDKNIGLIAGAGTGKTAVLTERFINIVRSKDQDLEKSLGQVLCITYTEKAAQEMRTRIEKALEEVIAGQGGSQTSTIGSRLNIYTIHGFCNKIIKANTYKLGLAMDYEIIEGYRLDQLIDTCLIDILQAYYDKTPDLKAFLIQEGYDSLEALARDIRPAYKTLRQKGYKVEDLLSKIQVEKSGLNYQDTIESLQDLLISLQESKVAKNTHKISKDHKGGIFSRLLDADSYQEDLQRLEDLKAIKDGFLRLKDFDQAEETASIIDGLIQDIESDHLGDYKLIGSIIIDLDQKLHQVKMAESVLDYDDLLYMANEVLEDDLVLGSLKKAYSHIMIDEFQDTNILQRDIFYKICSDKETLDRNNFFIVGDPKQSIYGFRGSDLAVFEESIEDIKRASGLIINLEENYRSSTRLIDFFNQTFTRLMPDTYRNLRSNVDVEKSHIGLIDYNKDTTEAMAIARKILALSNDRKLKEMAILFRSASNLKDLEDALNYYNIAYTNPKSREFYEKREIKDILLFVKFLILRDDHSLYGILRSGFFMIEDDLISQINLHGQGHSLYERLENYRRSNKKVLRAQAILGQALAKKDDLTVYENIERFLSKTYYKAYLARDSSNGQEVENVNKFLQIALDYSLEDSGFLNEFLAYIKDQAQDQENEASLGSLDAVSLMTIHGAKGLEFPMVFIYESTKVFRYRPSKIIVHGQEGLGMNYSYLTRSYDRVESKLKEEEMEELLRIYYVGMTRAEEDLYFFKEEDKDPPDDSLLGLVLADPSIGVDLDLDQDQARSQVLGFDPIVSDQSHVQSKIGKRPNPKPISSITAYMTYKKCPRLYYYTYVLKLGPLDQIQGQDQEDQDFKVDQDLPISALDYGTLIHSLIEGYQGQDMDTYIETRLGLLGLGAKDNLLARAKSHLKNFSQQDLPGRALYEYGFLLDLEAGKIRGAIDQVLLDGQDIRIVDFKTNRYGNLSDLVSYYRDQMIVYTYAASLIFERDLVGSYINFLDFNELVQLDISAKDIEDLVNNLNNFLSFIGLHDNIDLYKCSPDCDNKCTFKDICVG